MISERVREFIEESCSGCFVLNHDRVINEVEVMELINDSDGVIRTIVDNALVICRAEAIDIVEHL
ncbi:MAG: hypothetical protein KHZ99_06040 [Clostridium sp.]|uniref:hypothetical protein n=1 Tax=Clostridium sp. TaxID=1506 RepID=UPI0025BB8986|nr:hypothetical protein [Clostridium sp.]MBS4956591.1 hypothetical protein [Clostridium sp.]